MDAILTIIISTYNRCNIVISTISEMLKAKEQRLRFIICDNASSDDTWEAINNINDSRLIKLRNEKNMGILNFTLMSEKVSSPYFICINDRDLIRHNDIDNLVQHLENIKSDLVYDYYVNGMKDGYLDRQYTFYYWYVFDHPGLIIFNTDFYHKYVDYKIIYKYAIDNKMQDAYTYLTFTLLPEVQSAYLINQNYIQQNLNRDKIPRTRIEQYSQPFITVGYHEQEWDEQIEKGVDVKNSDEIFIALYKSSLIEIGIDYFYLVHSEQFRKRYDIEDLNPFDFLSNMKEYTAYVLDNVYTKKLNISKSINNEYDKIINYLKDWKNKVFKIEKVAEKIYLYGAGNYGQAINDLLHQWNIETTGFVVSDGYRKEDKIDGLKVYELNEIEDDQWIIVCAARDKLETFLNNLNTYKMQKYLTCF